METQGLGAGSYPEAPESEYKSYEVEFEAVVRCKTRVQVKDSLEIEEELAQINSCDVDEINDFRLIDILAKEEV